MCRASGGDVGLALAQRRQVDLERVDRGRTGPRGTASASIISRRSRLVAQRTRTSTRNGSFSPTRRISPDSRNRSSLTWMLLSSSPTSSRNSVPPLATSKSPLRLRVGAGEGALAVAEQLALDQVLGQGAAVDRDERRGRPGGSCRGGCGRSAPCRCRSRPGSGRWRRSARRSRSGGGPPASPASRRSSVGVPSAAFSRVSSAVALFVRSRRSATRLRMTSSSAHLHGLVR